MILSKKNIVGPLALLILLLTFFYSYASRSLFDSDFWWHISTGRHILQHNTIPDTDPFSFTSGLEENKNLYPYMKNNQIDSAIEVFEKAIMMKEKSYLYSNLASAYAKKGSEEKSRLMYQRALELENNNE
jgi:tetratricopeptide (TPR) repeat protein